jgi:Enterobacteria phage capsid assembly protease
MPELGLLVNIMARLARPLMAEEAALTRVLGVLGPRVGISEVAAFGEIFPVQLLADIAEDNRQARIQESREYRVQDGVAVVPVMGSLVSRSANLQPRSGLTGYSAIRHALAMAAADREVGGVLLEIDSPGGEAAGVMDLARDIRRLSAEKPVWATVNEAGFSAAYALASGAQRITAPRSAELGSIGVIAAHMDISGELAAQGRRVTIIKAGRHKGEFSPFAPLGREAQGRAQAQVDEVYAQFVELVADLRGLPAQAVRDTEAATLIAAEAARLGLADGVQPAGETLAEFAEYLNRGTVGRSPRREEHMESTAAAATMPAAMHSTAELERARAEARAEGERLGRALERERIRAILEHPEAAGRPANALNYALETPMEPDAAGRALAKLPAEAPTAQLEPTPFSRAMAPFANPNIGPDQEGGPQGEAAELEGLVQFLRQEKRRA